MNAKNELMEILPAYDKYIESKRKYQMYESDDIAMCHYMDLLCEEIADFIYSLYSGTETRKERHKLEETLSQLARHFSG